MWKVTVDTRLFDTITASEVHVARKVAELEIESIKRDLIMMGWTPPASEEQEEPECSDDDVARQCQNCISAVKCFFINESVDSPPFEQDCPDGIRFCKKKDRRVPAEWDGCEDGFEPVKVKSTQHNGYNPIYSCNNFGDNDGIQKNSENDQDQICADLAERNRELESELEQLRKELNASDSELEDKCVELDDIEADYASLKMALRGYCRLLINHQHKYLCRQDEALDQRLKHMRDYTLSKYFQRCL